MDNNQPSNDATYKRINAKQAKEFMESEDVIILDVRTLEEYNAGHIENAVLLPVTDISNKGEEILSNKDSKILVYCRSGNRSATASKQLIKMGYTNVYDFGGILSWPYEIIK
jgi:rhodanese-related sulfurtransferase